MPISSGNVPLGGAISEKNILLPETRSAIGQRSRAQGLRSTNLLSRLSIAFLLLPVTASAVTFLDVPPSDAISVLIEGPDGRLVRTLLANQRSAEKFGGRIEVAWDERDDAGRLVAPGNYTATLVANSIQFVWEGTVGNTSRDAASGGEHIFRSYEPIRQMAFDAAGNAFYVVGYNEQQANFHRFATSDAQTPSAYLFDDFTRSFDFVDTDGKLVYYANVGTIGSLVCPGTINEGTKTFMVATSVRDNTIYHWGGNAEKISGSLGASGDWYGIDVATNAPSKGCDSPDNLHNPDRWRRAANGGIAVQRRAAELFVAHTDENLIHVFNKISGELDTTIAVAAPSSLCTAADDSIWVLSTAVQGAELLHFSGSGSSWTLSGAIRSGFALPLAIGCNPADNSVAVIDAGSMQVKNFAPSGRLQWSLGSPGGHRSRSPDIRSDRFGFLPGFSYIAFLPDGSFWVGDPFNFRYLHFSNTLKPLDQIAYLPATYRTAVDRDEPERVFAQFLEYRIDYSKPLLTSWTLVRNWKSGLSRDYVPARPVDVRAGIQRPFLLSNGRTYATVFNFTSNSKEIVELDNLKGLRATGIFLPFNVQMYAGGTLRFSITGNASCGNPCRIYERRLTGFDSASNPQWGPAVTIAQTPGVQGADPVRFALDASDLSEAVYPETAAHRIVSFNISKIPGFHLGAVARGGSDWNWRTSPTGQFTTNRSKSDAPLSIVHSGSVFPIDNSGLGLQAPLPELNYAGGSVDALGSLIVFSYAGENWNAAEASQYMLFEEDGAMLGQFGEVGYPSVNRLRAVPGFAGNPYSISLVRAQGKVYLYVNDESGHGGVHRWRLDRLDTTKKIAVPVAVPLR